MAALVFKTFDGYTYRFKTEDELQAFVTQELEALRWISSMQGTPPAHQIQQLTILPLTNAQTYLRQEPQTPETLEQAKSNVQAYLNVNPPVHAKSALRPLLEKQAKLNPVETLYMLGTIGQRVGAWSNFQDHIGAFSSFPAGIALGVAYLEGWRPDEKADAFAQSAADSSQEASVALAGAKAAQEEAESIAAFFKEWDIEHRARLAQLDDDLRVQHEKYAEDLRAAQKATEDGLTEDWRRLTATYDTKLSLQAPANYWRKKHFGHRSWVTKLGIAGGIWATAGALALAALARYVFQFTTANQVPTWFQVIAFSLGALVYVLGLRSVLKLLMSHVHLALDAAERQTMIVSYLALMKKSGIKEDTLEHILGTIFRPTGDGVVKDEAMPISILSEFFRKP
jgi:hypothetical protein